LLENVFCLGLKYFTQAVQEIMEMKMAEHIRESLEKSLPDLATNPKLAKKMKLDNPMVVSGGTARSAMTPFLGCFFLLYKIATMG